MSAEFPNMTQHASLQKLTCDPQSFQALQTGDVSCSGVGRWSAGTFREFLAAWLCICFVLDSGSRGSLQPLSCRGEQRVQLSRS